MKSLINITVKEYMNSPNAASYEIFDSLMPANSFAGKQMNIQAMPYANVRYCFRLLSKDSWEIVQRIFEICYDVSEHDFYSEGVKEFFQAKKYLIRSFEDVMQTEVKVLSSQSTDAHLWDMAGADKLKPYNDTLPLAQLGKHFGIYPFDLGRKPYGEIFNLLAQLKVQNEVEAEYQKLKSK